MTADKNPCKNYSEKVKKKKMEQKNEPKESSNSTASIKKCIYLHESYSHIKYGRIYYTHKHTPRNTQQNNSTTNECLMNLFILK